MPYVQNLGQYGSARESSLSGLSDALAGGLQIRNQRETAKSNAATLKLGQENKELENKKLTAQLARDEVAQQTTDRENTVKSIDRISMYLNGKPGPEQELYKQTDQYKALVKHVKSVLPEMIDKNGDVILSENKEIYSAHLEKIAAQNAQTLAAGGQLTQGQQAAQDVIDKVGARNLAVAMDLASQDDDFTSGSAEEKQAAIQRAIKSVMQGQGQMRGEPPPNPEDPMNILSAGLGGL